jgi:hypothetical protein
MEFKPAHEESLHAIRTHCSNLAHVERLLAAGCICADGRPVSRSELESGRHQEIGGLCSLLRVLGKMFIPESELKSVIESLKSITYRHVELGATVTQLESRIGITEAGAVAAASEQTDESACEAG